MARPIALEACVSMSKPEDSTIETLASLPLTVVPDEAVSQHLQSEP
jgi:hypothetical protein